VRVAVKKNSNATPPLPTQQTNKKPLSTEELKLFSWG